MLAKINKHWGWSGLNGVEIVDHNEFGNILVMDEKKVCWRICPEELSCDVVARDPFELARLVEDQVFLADWNMSNHVEIARRHLGRLKEGWVYYTNLH